MKRLIIIQILLCASIATAAIDPNLVAWWKLDEGTGNIAYDSAGDNDGTLYGNLQWIPGNIGSYTLDFDGNGDYIIGSSSPFDFEDTTFTVSAWIKTAGLIQVILSEGGYAGGWFLGDGGNDYQGRIRVMLKRSGSTNNAYMAITQDMYNDDQWHHIAAVITTSTTDPSGNNADIYIDGSSVFVSEVRNYSYGASTEHWRIGARPIEPAYFDGSIDDVRIYNRALSAKEIEELYEEGLPELTGLEITGPDEVAENSTASYKAIANYDDGTTKDVTTLAEWSVKPDSPATIEAGQLTTEQLLYPEQDVTIYASFTENNVTVEAEKPVSVLAICPVGTALEFDGSNDFVQIPNSASNQITTNQISISAWIKLKSEVGSTQRRVICKQQGNNRSWGLEIFGKGYEGFVGNQVNFHDSSGAAFRNCTSLTNLIPGNWYHIGVSDNAGQIRLYINGSLNKAIDNGYGIPAQINAPVMIGRTNPESLFYFDGIIDELAVFDRALSAGEIQAIMLTKLTGSEPDLVAYWDFDEGEGQTATDVSGNGNNGTLGSSPEPDAADPCWVESNIPAQCTTEQVIVRNLLGATENKEAANELLADAKAKERASARLIDDLKKQLRGRELIEAIRAKSLIHIALVQEEIASRQINMTISRLKEALCLLGYEEDPDDQPCGWPWPSCLNKNEPQSGPKK